MATNSSPPTPDLPTLTPGVTVLTADAVGPLHALILDHLLVEDGQAVWVDSHGRATMAPLARLAPSGRVLDKVAVARGFTAYQHYSLVEDLRTRLDDRTADVALVAVPVVDWHYRTDDLRETEGAAMLGGVADHLAAIAAAHDLPVLATRETADAFSSPIETVADATLACELTRFGPRFVGETFETLVYPHGDGTVQTTLAFWERVLERRARAADARKTGVSSVGAH